jgi:hypothetical protein
MLPRARYHNHANQLRGAGHNVSHSSHQPLMMEAETNPEKLEIHSLAIIYCTVLGH